MRVPNHCSPPGYVPRTALDARQARARAVQNIRHRTFEEIGDDVLNSVRCIAPALVADSDAAEHEYWLFHILEIRPGVPGLVQVKEMHGEAPGAAS